MKRTILSGEDHFSGRNSNEIRRARFLLRPNQGTGSTRWKQVAVSASVQARCGVIPSLGPDRADIE